MVYLESRVKAIVIGIQRVSKKMIQEGKERKSPDYMGSVDLVRISKVGESHQRVLHRGPTESSLLTCEKIPL